MSSMPFNWQRTNRTLLTVVCIAGALLCQSAYTNYMALETKAKQQASALSQLKRWKSEYEALRPFQTQWDSTLPPVKDITDIYRVFTAIRLDEYGLSTNQEHLVIKKIDPVLSNGISLNATRICINSAGETGLAVTAPRFAPDLLNGIDGLLKRRDIEVTNIVLSAVSGVPKAVLDLCLVFRA